MKISIEKTEKFVILKIDGKFITSSTKKFEEAINGVIDENPNIIIDLSKMTFIDSSGLGELIKYLHKSINLGGSLKLACLDAHPAIVFNVTKVDRVFEIFDTVEDAIRSFE